MLPSRPAFTPLETGCVSGFQLPSAFSSATQPSFAPATWYRPPIVHAPAFGHEMELG